MDFFLQLYGTLPRAGPGDNQSTRRAIEMLDPLSDDSRILDIGCGPGVQTIELARSVRGNITAIDYYPQMIDRISEAAEKSGFSDRIQVVRMDMSNMEFAESTFDLIWSEGAIYLMGFQNGLRVIRRLLKPSGYVAVTEAVWLQSEPPSELREFWQEYPEIGTVEEKKKVVADSGYDLVGHFTLPQSSWIDEYYGPLGQRIAEFTEHWETISEARAVLDEARKELEMFEKYGDHYGYEFFVMRK